MDAIRRSNDETEGRASEVIFGCFFCESVFGGKLRGATNFMTDKDR